jgi:DNA polymerase-3 subunit gamma/tau
VRCEVGAGETAAPEAAPAREPAPAPPDPRAAEEEELIAEAVRDADDQAPRRDPEEAALELLQSELGARRIDS